MKAWLFRVPCLAQEPTSTVGERKGRGNSGPSLECRPTGSKAILVAAPPGAGLSGFLFGGKPQQNPTRQNEEEARVSLAGPFRGLDASFPYPGLVRTSLPGPCPPLTFGKRSWAGWLCAPINLPGGRRAGGLGAVCNFAASVAAVPGERAPALAPIGRRRVSWCDLLLSLLAFGHPETNQFDDY